MDDRSTFQKFRMKQALILFHSRKGKTKKYAERIGCYLNSLNIEANVLPLERFRKDLLTSADYVLIGCWSRGFFLFNQKPEKVWIDFARSLPLKRKQAIGLFTTYNIRTGTMFRNMRKYLINASKDYNLELKSRDGKLSEKDKENLLSFLNQVSNTNPVIIPEEEIRATSVSFL